jgi:hypothetical protein
VPTPLLGTAGVITWGGTNVVWAGTWTATVTNETEEIGPHIGDATLYQVATSQGWEWSIEGTVPSAGDAGQNAIMAAATGRTTAALVLEQTLGKTITFSAANVNELEVSVEADGTQTFTANGTNGSGTVTLTQDT